MKYILATIFLLISVIHLNAQEENSSKIIGKNKVYSLWGGGVETSTTSYINTDTKDSNGVNLYIAPYLEYSHKSGLGIRVKSYALLSGSNAGFYLTSLSPYFAKYDGPVFPYISYTRYIQHNNPSIPYSPIQNDIYAHVRLQTKYIDPWAGVDIGFGNDEQNNKKSVSDINAYVALTHLFLKDMIGVKKNNTLGVRPSFQLNAGTDRYFKFTPTASYISQNTKANRTGYSRSRSSTISMPANIYTISEENEFSLSNIEVNLYVMYFFDTFSVEPSGSLYFPLRGEDRTPYGYWQINFNYWLK
jgi:hypothetical protein